ncbi:Ca2+ transporter [Trichoderma evansii]
MSIIHYGYDFGAFISALFLFEFGADRFIAHTATIASRAGISEATLGLVTAVAGWGQLTAIVVSLERVQFSLALGTVIGSAISNILGAFSFGLLCYEEGSAVEFDRSSRIHSLLTLILTTVVIPLIYFQTTEVWLNCAGFLMIGYVVYFSIVAVKIRRSARTASEDSDNDGDDNGDDCDENDARSVGSTTGLLADGSNQNVGQHRLSYHVLYTFFGLLAICLASYVLSQAAIEIIKRYRISDVLFGVVILTNAITLPGNFIAVKRGHRGYSGILVANCAGSNIVLLSLCCGMVMGDAKGFLNGDNVTVFELAVLWISTAAFAGTVWFGARFPRRIGRFMVAGYVAFIILEFAVIH